jgi:hypothetical protein
MYVFLYFFLILKVVLDTIPLDEISREALLCEFPTLVYIRRQGEGILLRENSRFEYATSIDKYLACQSIDVHCVTVMWAHELMYRVSHTQLPICGYDKWFYHRMGVEPEK